MAVLILDAPIKAFAKAIDLSIKTVVERITFDLWNKITLRTPVDTGRARQSWQLGIGAPNTTVPGPMGGGTGQYSKDSSPPTNPPAMFPGGEIDGTQTVFITSSLAYIGILEEGRSMQAPAGMVQLSIAEVQAELELIVEGMNQ